MQAIEAAGHGIPASKPGSLTSLCLRHTATSLMAAAGIPQLDIARVLGQSMISVTMR